MSSASSSNPTQQPLAQAQQQPPPSQAKRDREESSDISKDSSQDSSKRQKNDETPSLSSEAVVGSSIVIAEPSSSTSLAIELNASLNASVNKVLRQVWGDMSLPFVEIKYISTDAMNVMNMILRTFIVAIKTQALTLVPQTSNENQMIAMSIIQNCLGTCLEGYEKLQSCLDEGTRAVDKSSK